MQRCTVTHNPLTIGWHILQRLPKKDGSRRIIKIVTILFLSSGSWAILLSNSSCCHLLANGTSMTSSGTIFSTLEGFSEPHDNEEINSICFCNICRILCCCCSTCSSISGMLRCPEQTKLERSYSSKKRVEGRKIQHQISMIERWIPSFINEMGLGNESHSPFSSTKAARLASLPASLVLAPLGFEDVRHDGTGFCTLSEGGTL